MSCPRCDGPFLEYHLDGSAATVCERCGHVGISTTFDVVSQPVESWDVSLERFRKQESVSG